MPKYFLIITRCNCTGPKSKRHSLSEFTPSIADIRAGHEFIIDVTIYQDVHIKLKTRRGFIN